MNSHAVQSAESEISDIGDEFPIQIGGRCYVHLPSYKHQKIDVNDQLVSHISSKSLSQIVRVACLRSSTILPLLDGRSPLLFAIIDVDLNKIDKSFTNNLTIKKKTNAKNDIKGFIILKKSKNFL